MQHFYKFGAEEFDVHYHKRSKDGSTFGMMEAKFGERLRRKTEAARINEALCEVLAHNLCCVIQSIHELGTSATFESEMVGAS